MIDSLSGLMNSLSGLGTARDKGVGGSWAFLPLDDGQLEYCYRGSWMARKAVDIPAFDMVREGWQWQADEDVVTRIEAVERRLNVREKVQDAISLGRLYGGSAILMSDGSANPAMPLNVERVRQGQLKFITVLSRRYITAGEVNTDPRSPGFLSPTFYTLNLAGGAATRVHPSRVIVFDGAKIPDAHVTGNAGRTSDSVLDAVNAAIQDATAGQQGIASLIQEAKLDVIKVPGLTEKIASTEYENRLIRRFGLATQGKSLVNALLLDAEEEYDQKSVDFSALPDVVRLLIQVVSGAVDIPATRFLGQAPQGMNATGDGDLRNYYDRLSSDQELRLRPRLEQLFDVMVRSEIGNRPDGLTFDFNPLWQLSEKEQSEVGKQEAETDQIYINSGAVPMPVMERAIRNRLIERGQYPGIEDAYEDFDRELAANPDLALPDPGRNPNDDPDDDLDDDDDPDIRDAKPRTLFVQRKLLNAGEFIRWAKGQGFDTTVPEDELHVTIAFSRAPVDWVAMGQDFTGSDDGNLTISAGGPRLVEALGDKGAIVLMFASSALSWRHEDMKRNGASWDFPEYQPHVTITFSGDGIDLDQVEPFRGELRFGPEIFEEVDDTFTERLVEE